MCSYNTTSFIPTLLSGGYDLKQVNHSFGPPLALASLPQCRATSIQVAKQPFFAPYHYASTNSHLVMDLGGPVIIVGFSDACHYILGIRMHIMSHANA